MFILGSQRLMLSFCGGWLRLCCVVFRVVTKNITNLAWKTSPVLQMLPGQILLGQMLLWQLSRNNMDQKPSLKLWSKSKIEIIAQPEFGCGCCCCLRCKAIFVTFSTNNQNDNIFDWLHELSKQFQIKKNTSLVAKGALAHRLQCRSACKIQNGR